MSNSVVLITSRSFGSTSATPAKILADAGCEIIQTPKGEAALLEALSSADGWIAGTETVTEAMVAAAPRLRVLARHGIGVDNVPLAAAQRRGIVVTNTPGANTEAVAELAIGLMLATARRLMVADQQTRQGVWKAVVGGELCGKTLGIVGLGNIGKVVVRRLAGFEMRVLAYDVLRDETYADGASVRYCTLGELLRESDFVSLHAPLLPATRGMIGAAELGLMKRTAILINTARGEIVDEGALIDALQARRIAGAGLDAFVHEPPGDSTLFKLDNVVVTSHIGAHTTEALTAMSTMAAENIAAVLQGRPAPNQVV